MTESVVTPVGPAIAEVETHVATIRLIPGWIIFAKNGEIPTVQKVRLSNVESIEFTNQSFSVYTPTRTYAVECGFGDHFADFDELSVAILSA